MLKFIPLLLLFYCCPSLPGAAQGENNNWTFGHNNGLNFNNNPPTFFATNSISLEGSAAVSDAAGHLLFYSNGNDVWTAAGTVMPNGSGILGNGSAGFAPCSSAQGVAIVHAPANRNQYYLFTLDASEQVNPITYPGYLRYSVVDMSLNGGAGDVVATQKNIILDTAMTEQMTVVKGAGCYYWLLSHRNNSTQYRAFKIDGAGIHPGVSSHGTAMSSIGSGQMKVSPDGTKVVNSNTLLSSGIELGTFDIATGIVSGAILFDLQPSMVRLGACFSPDNSKLYITTYNDMSQYSLAGYPGPAAIEATKVILNNHHQFSNLRNGPDGKIYAAVYQNHPFICAINNPDVAGAGCNLNLTALPQPAWAAFAATGNPYGHGLGNDMAARLPTDTTINSTQDTLVCFAAAIHVAAPAGYNEYLWNDGTAAPSRPLHTDGTYWVYSYENCDMAIDTFRVKFLNLDVNLGPDTAICINSTLLLDATIPGATYRWQDGSANATFTATQKGSYSVEVSRETCILGDTINISTFDPFMQIVENDTQICNDEILTLHTTANPLGTFLWSTGSTAPEIIIDKAGHYSVTATGACGTFTDAVTITTESCDCKSFVPNAFSPNGDQVNDVFKVRTNCNATDFTLSIYNRYSQCVFTTRSPDAVWDGTFNGRAMDTGTYFFYMKFKGPRGDNFERKGDIILLR